MDSSQSIETRGVEILDDLDHIRSVDRSDMYASIMGFPDQLRAAADLVAQVDWPSFKPTTPAGICLCGMGGSAIGGDLVRSYWEYDSTVPFIVVRNDRLPGEVNRFYLIIASSYSGNTAEVLSAIAQAKSRGCQILVLTSGGDLADVARQAGWPSITVPGGLAPRAALGYSLGPVMLALARWGIVPDRTQELKTAADSLDATARQLGRDIPLENNPAKQLAAAIGGRPVCVYGSTGSSDVIAARIKGQLCENAKTLAFANSFPELNHNEIVGLDRAAALSAAPAVMTLQSADDGAIATQQRLWLERRLQESGTPAITLTATGENRLQRMLSLIQLGDLISYYLAILSKVNPTPVAAIENLKSHLAKVL